MSEEIVERNNHTVWERASLTHRCLKDDGVRLEQLDKDDYLYYWCERMGFVYRVLEKTYRLDVTLSYDEALSLWHRTNILNGVVGDKNSYLSSHGMPKYESHKDMGIKVYTALRKLLRE